MRARPANRRHVIVRVLLLTVLSYPLTAATDAYASPRNGPTTHRPASGQCALPLAQRTGGWTCFSH
jgi:hypothetical protein